MSEDVSVQKPSTVVNPHRKATYEEFISFAAIGGLVTDELGRIKPMQLSEFCREFNISERETQRWKKMPDFGERVRERRYQLWPVARETMLYNELLIVAKTSKDHKAKVEAAKTLLGHFSDLQLPVQRQDVKVGGGLLDLLQGGRELFNKDPAKTIEGEVVDANPNTEGN